MKKFKYILFTLTCFMICIFKTSALNGCSSETIEEFNKTLSSSNITGNKVCSYGNYNTDSSSICHIEVYEDASSDPINPHFYVYKVCALKNSGKTTAKMMMCSHQYGEGKYEVHTPLYTFTDVATPEAEEVGYWFFDNTLQPDINYHVQISQSTEDEMGVIDRYLKGKESGQHECPLYMGVRYEPGTGWEALQVSANKDFNGMSYNDASGATIKISTTSCYDTNGRYVCTGTDVVTGKKVIVTPEKQKLESEDLPSVPVEKYESNLCKTDGVLKALDSLHTIIKIARIAVPLIIIIIGSIEFGKTAIDGSEDMLKKSTMKMIKKVIIGLLVFFVPLSIDLIFGIFSDKDTSKFQFCSICFTGSKGSNGETCGDLIKTLDPDYEYETTTDEEKTSDTTKKSDVKHATGCASATENGLGNYALSKCTDSNGTVDEVCYDQTVNDSILRDKYQTKCSCKQEADNYVNSSNVCSGSSINTEQCKNDLYQQNYKSCINDYCNNDLNNGASAAARKSCGNDSSQGFNSCYNMNVSNLHTQYYNSCINDLN